jgi:hypothetical protein
MGILEFVISNDRHKREALHLGLMNLSISLEGFHCYLCVISVGSINQSLLRLDGVAPSTEIFAVTLLY